MEEEKTKSKKPVAIGAVVVIVLIVIVGFFVIPKKGGEIVEEQQAQTAFFGQDSAREIDMTQSFEQAEQVAQEGVRYQAVLKTTEGDITIELDSTNTPITTNNFIFLAQKDFYNNTVFHRVLSGFMIQGGDPTGTGAGGPGYRFADEPVVGEYARGTVAMANAGPDTNGSQFFIVHQDTPLPPQYVIFGKVVKGIETVDSIASGEVVLSPQGEPSNPVSPVTIESVEISEL